MKTSRGIWQKGEQWTAALLVGALASLLWAQAAHAARLSLGSHYNILNFMHQGAEGGGSISPAFLDGTALAFVYCADVYTNVNVPGSYDTYVSTDGAIHKTSRDATGVVVTYADQVAWLVEHYAFGAITDALKQQALQSAIWHEIYGGFTPSNPSVAGLFNTYVAAIPIDVPNTEHTHIQWLSPEYSDGSPAQGLVTITNPEPSTVLLLATGLLGVLGYGWWRRPHTA